MRKSAHCLLQSRLCSLTVLKVGVTPDPRAPLLD